MTVLVFVTVLIAAALHASWNAVVKGGADQLMTTIMVATSASVAAAAVLPFLEAPRVASWPFIAASVVIHVVYFVLVGLAYRAGDMGQTYPLMRGTAPFLVALGGAFVFADHLSISAWTGVGLISFGIITMVREGKSNEARGIYLALSNAVVIASYTLIDGFGARLSSSPAAYAAWVFMLTGLLLSGWAIVRKRTELAGAFRKGWKGATAGGIATVVSYALVLRAMTMAPVPMVAALRETSILFGTIIAVSVLRERIGPARMIGAGLIGLGAVALRLA